MFPWHHVRFCTDKETITDTVRHLNVCFLWFRCLTKQEPLSPSLYVPNTHTHTHTHWHTQWPQAWHVGHKFQDTPRCSQSAVPTACRPTSGHHLYPIRATRGLRCRTHATKKKKSIHCVPPQSHPALFNYWAHSINFMLLTQWEHIKVYWIKRRRGSISRWLMQTSDSVQSLSAKPHWSASLLYTKCHLCLKRGYFTSFITFVAKTCYQSALTETIRWFTIKNKLFFLG